MSLAFQIFNLIKGSWKISRKIAGTGYLNGFAKFENSPNDPNELFYSENGIFFFDDGKSLEASKKYIYRYKNDDIYVYFNDKQATPPPPAKETSVPSSNEQDLIIDDDSNGSNRLFHQFNINNASQSLDEQSKTNNGHSPSIYSFRALHLCGDDKYNVLYEFNLDNDQEFSIVYDVKGPKKNYISQTNFKRINKTFI